MVKTKPFNSKWEEKVVITVRDTTFFIQDENLIHKNPEWEHQA